MAVYIYALVDPDTKEVRYVGRSSEPKDRYRRHIREAELGNERNIHKRNWICKLLREGKQPDLLILEECNGDTWPAAERYHIKQYRDTGANLLNIAEGGISGTEGRRHDEETKRRIRVSTLARNYHHTEEAHSKMKKAWALRRDNGYSRPISCKVCKIKHPRQELNDNRICKSCNAETKLCDCGCKESITKYKTGGRIRKYKAGHGSAIALRGKHLSEEQKAKISLSNTGKRKGIPKSEEHKRKIGEGMKNAPHYLRGKSMPEKQKVKISNSINEHYNHLKQSR